MIVDYPTSFSKQVELKVKTNDGLKPLISISGLVRSLAKSEEERRKVLILAEDAIRNKRDKEIRKAVNDFIGS